MRPNLSLNRTARRQAVPRRSGPATERHPMIQCPHEPGREQHQDRRRNVDPHRRTVGSWSRCGNKRASQPDARVIAAWVFNGQFPARSRHKQVCLRADVARIVPQARRL
jgi:hypothetical protein